MNKILSVLATFLLVGCVTTNSTQPPIVASEKVSQAACEEVEGIAIGCPVSKINLNEYIKIDSVFPTAESYITKNRMDGFFDKNIIYVKNGIVLGVAFSKYYLESGDFEYMATHLDNRWVRSMVDLNDDDGVVLFTPKSGVLVGGTVAMMINFKSVSMTVYYLTKALEDLR